MNSHCHPHEREDSQTRRRGLFIVLAATATYMVVELIGGWVSGSLALVADAGHMATDVAAIILGLIAAWIATRPADDEKTFGYQRAEILAALANGAGLAFMAVWILVEAIHRLGEAKNIDGRSMGVIAAGGLIVNVFSLFILHIRGGRSAKNLNLHGVWLHVFSDALGSFSALVASFCVGLWGWNSADSIASILIAGMVLWASLRLVVQSVDVLLEAVPRGVILADIRRALTSVENVEEVHDLHVWVVTNGVSSLSVHVRVTELADHGKILEEVGGILKSRFSIEHSTVQLEPPNYAHGPLHA